jgi:putative peptidoglycan lipid II flippase
MSLARNMFAQSFFTLGSRILGFARDLLLSARFGQGAMMDVWGTAILIPNLFRRLFAEGAFAQAFVPVYGKIHAESGADEAARVASNTMSFLMFVVVGFCIVMQVAMPALMPWLLSVYRSDEQVMRTAVFVTQLTMPYLACMTLASLLQGVLNTAGRFALAAAAPILLNVFTIAPLILAPNNELALWIGCGAVTAAGVAQAGLLWWGARRLGVKLRFGAPTLTPEVRRVMVLAIPGAIAGGALQLNSLISQILAGSSEGARAVLYNADRLYQLPLGLVGVAIGLALVPRLTRAFVADDHDAGVRTMDDGIALSMAFTLPAAAALLIMPYFIIDATATRGAFTSEDARRTANVLQHFAWGVPAFVLAKVLTPPFFARQDTARPMRFSLITVAANTALSAALFYGLTQMGRDGVQGLAIATSVCAWLNVALLSRGLARDGLYKVGPAVWARLLRIGLATGLMAIFTTLCAMNYDRLTEIFRWKEVAVVMVVLAAFSLYGLAALAVRAISVSELRGALRREKNIDHTPGLPGGMDG